MKKYEIPLKIFDCKGKETQVQDEVLEREQETILRILRERHIEAEKGAVSVGPTLVTYIVSLPRTISPRKVMALCDDISLWLGKVVRIYPNYEDGCVVVEVPRDKRDAVLLGELLEDGCLSGETNKKLTVVLGKDGKNQACTQDLCKLIHTLVAGRTASGKSVFLNSVIMSLVYNHSPQDVRLILIDPKRVEFTSYQGLPHLILGRPITDFSESIGVLQWAITEMERRYTLFEKMCYEGVYVVNVDQYNEKLANEGDKLPKIVIIIDELADLMLADKRNVEETLHTLTQKARAAGIYLIVSTQRPSVDVLTGVIKANFMTRIAFSVASEIDSRVILDQAGAQSLLGRGDYLYSQPGKNELTRMQAPYVSEKEIASVVEYVKANWDSMQDDDVKEFLQKAKEKKVEVLEQELFEEEETRIRESYEGLQRAIMEQWDPTPDSTYLEALKLVIEMKDPSISMVRRKCDLSYNEAGKIVEWMEDMGYISPFDGAKKRDVLITMEEFEMRYGKEENEEASRDELQNEHFENEKVAVEEEVIRKRKRMMHFVPKEDLEPCYIKALRMVIQENSASISMLQRKCDLSYNKSGQMIEWMEDMGYVSPFDGAKKRDVLITMKQFEAFYGGQEEEDETLPESNEENKPTDDKKTGKHRGYPPF